MTDTHISSPPQHATPAGQPSLPQPLTAAPERPQPTLRHTKPASRPPARQRSGRRTDAAAGLRGEAEPAAGPKPGAAPKPKHAGGRPRKIQSVEEFETRLNGYLDTCEASETPVTLSGAILALGLCSREGLDGYAERPEFTDAVKRAKLLVAQAYESRLHLRDCVGAIFALKNLGWSDRQEVAFSGSLASIDYSRLTDEQLQRIAGGEHPLAVLGSAAPTPVRALSAGTADTESK